MINMKVVRNLIPVKNYIFPNCMQPSLVDVNIHLGFLLFGLSGVTTPGQ